MSCERSFTLVTASLILGLYKKLDRSLSASYHQRSNIGIIWSPTAPDHPQAIYDDIVADNRAVELEVHEEIECTAGRVVKGQSLARSSEPGG